LQTQFRWIPFEQPYNFCKAWLYFLLIVFAWKLETDKPRSVVSPNLQVLCSWILDMLCVISFLTSVPKIAQSYCVDRLLWFIWYLW
jgi:hypothetical protein